MDKLLEKQRNTCIFIGDINMDLLRKTQIVNDYKNMIKANAFQIQNIISNERATRVTTTTASILDHVITNKYINHKIMCVKVKEQIPKEKIKKKILNKEMWWLTRTRAARY